MKLFIILSRVPFPLDKGDKLRAFHQIKHLSKSNEIHLCCLNDIKIDKSSIKAIEPYCKTINVFKISRWSKCINVFLAFLSGKPFQVGYFYNSSIRKKISNLIMEIEPDHIFCQLIRVTEYVKHVQISKTLDYQDVLSKGMERRLANCQSYLRPVIRYEASKLKKYESLIFDHFDNKTIISDSDRQCIDHPKKNEIVIVPNGVDIDFFTPQKTAKEFDLLFTGNMSYPPNVLSVEYIVKRILPIVHIVNPDVRLLIAGIDPSHRVKMLASEKVIVSGWVDDIRKCYDRSRIFIAPMQIGTGMQNKILEAMAMKLPCITSNLANNSIGAADGKEILIADAPQKYADIVNALLADESMAMEIAEKGNNFVRNIYNWSVQTSKLEDLFKQNKC
jgi:sugar transferase (PEP-CTERM/EpsH1 system associated)